MPWFTFKRDRKRWHDDQYHIKLKGKKVGFFMDKEPYTVRLVVKKEDPSTSSNPNCEWRWFVIEKKFNSVEEVKTWVHNHTAHILESLKGLGLELYFMED